MLTIPQIIFTAIWTNRPIYLLANIDNVLLVIDVLMLRNVAFSKRYDYINKMSQINQSVVLTNNMICEVVEYFKPTKQITRVGNKVRGQKPSIRWHSIE